MFLGLVCKQELLSREGSGKVTSHYPSVPNSSLYLPLFSQMAPGANEQLGASEALALWKLHQGELAQDLFLKGWTRALGEDKKGRFRKELGLVEIDLEVNVAKVDVTEQPGTVSLWLALFLCTLG